MGTNKDSQISNDRRKWQKIFNAVVHMLQTQQIQLESLVKERKLLEDRIQIQHDRWVSDVHLLEEQVSQMKTDVSQAELYRMLEAAKSDLVVGLKLRESFFYKQKLGCTETDLKDLKLWVDYLTHKLSEQKGGSQEKIEEIGRGGGGDNYPKSLENTEEEEWRCSKILEGEVRKIKRAHEKLISEKESEVSALLAERNFVWNQFKKMESDYNSLLKSKHVEVKQTNEKIEKLLTHMEQLQSSNSEKDETILKLRKKLSKLDAETDKGSKEISTLSRELELLRKSRSASVTPVLNRCMIESSTCSLESKSNGRERRPPVKKELAGSHTYDIMKESEKGCRSSKRRGVEAIPISETPRLFSSTFKVPKLKNSSSLARVS